MVLGLRERGGGSPAPYEADSSNEEEDGGAVVRVVLNYQCFPRLFCCDDHEMLHKCTLSQTCDPKCACRC